MSKTTEVTEYHKQIYNKYLAISRSCANKPFRLRKDFSKFEETESFYYVRKLTLFFTRFPDIDLDDFFRAPYNIYPDVDSVFDLKFYTTQRALKVYTMYMNNKRAQSPDSDDQLFSIKKSIQYIVKFCANNNIKIFEYPKHTTGCVPSFVEHVKRGKVSLYVLFGFPDFEKVIQTMDSDVIDITLGNMHKNLPTFRTAYYASSLAKKFITAALTKVSKAELQS